MGGMIDVAEARWRLAAAESSSGKLCFFMDRQCGAVFTHRVMLQHMILSL